VVSFTTWPLYPQEKSPRYHLDRRLGGTHSHSGCGGEGKIPSPCWESNPRTPILILVVLNLRVLLPGSYVTLFKFILLYVALLSLNTVKEKDYIDKLPLTTCAKSNL
jgi:hypothetical protein